MNMHMEPSHSIEETSHNEPVDEEAVIGLSQDEATRRLAQYGPNELAEEKANPVLKFLSYFWGPIPWMIEVAAILSAVVQHYEDLAIISVLLVVNAIIGFWEEYQAGNTIAALKEKLAVRARVHRDGAWKVIQARELVPGDLIRLRIGDIIPADAQLLSGDPIQVDQSALTGESLPITRGLGEGVYSGSVVKQGEIQAVVSSTGKNTYFGKTAHLVETAHTTSHFQRAVLNIGNFLIVLAIILAVIILAFAFWRGDPLTTTLQFVLVLTVAAIPVAMPTVLSVTMAVGARLLALKQAVVSRLASVEELAGIDILCSDKTGTLTKNQLTLGEPFTLDGIEPQLLIKYGALASLQEDADPIDLAIISGLDEAHATDGYQRLHYQPFDPVSKRTEVLVKGPDGHILQVTKGAPQIILALSANQAEVKERVNLAVSQFASRGYRSLGVAVKGPDHGWKFMGVLPLYDPPREDSRETIATARKMGIQVKMITGDQVIIGKEIARQLDLGTNIKEAEVLQDPNRRSDDDLAILVEQADGFAQVFPEHKYHIVEALQHHNHIVGMTGDGVNDAPALKKADAGIAVSGATDAARSAADIVLLTPGLSVIVDAVRESRKIFQRMNSYATYRIAETIRVLLFMTLSIVVFNFYPVTAIMIVLLALLNDGAILSIAYDNVRPSDKPEKWDMRMVLGLASVLGIAGVIASFGVMYLGERVFHLNREMIQTLMYLKLSVAGHLTIFLTRTRGPFWSIKPSRILVAAVGITQFVATLISVYGIFMPPIGWGWALLVWGYALAWFLVNDLIKVIARRFLERRNKPVTASN